MEGKRKGDNENESESEGERLEEVEDAINNISSKSNQNSSRLL
jgi:hypothetical protein